MQKQDTRTMLLNDSPWKLMVSLSLPAIIGMVVIGLYNFMDSVFVGNMIGSVAMTAVKVSYPFTLFNSGISTLFGVGSASVLSRAVGKKDQGTIDKIMGNLISGVLISSIIITVFGIIFARQLLSLTGVSGEYMDLAVRYLRIIFTGSIFVNFAQAANMVMRGEGVLKRAMLIMGIGAVLNIILDPILLHVTKDVSGAAYATVISQIIQAVITLWYFIKVSKNVRIHKIGFDKEILPQVLGVGVSAMLMQVMQMVQQTVMYNVAERWGGPEWQTILGACMSLSAFSFIPLWGLSQGFQPAVGTNYGAKVYSRVRKITFVFTLGATVLAALFYIPIMSFPGAMLSMFIPDNPEIIALGAPMLRVLFSIFILYGVMICSITLFQALGKAAFAGIVTILRSAVIFIPMVCILPMIGGLGVKGVFYAQFVTDAIVIVLTLLWVLGMFKKMPKEDMRIK